MFNLYIKKIPHGQTPGLKNRSFKSQADCTYHLKSSRKIEILCCKGHKTHKASHFRPCCATSEN